jgi:hypothetical protein
MENDSKCHDSCVGGGVSYGHVFRKMPSKARIVSKIGHPSSKHVKGLYNTYRVPECLSLRPSSPPPPGTKGGGSNTHLLVRGRPEPIRTTGEKAWHSVYSVSKHHLYSVSN